MKDDEPFLIRRNRALETTASNAQPVQYAASAVMKIDLTSMSGSQVPMWNNVAHPRKCATWNCPVLSACWDQGSSPKCSGETVRTEGHSRLCKMCQEVAERRPLAHINFGSHVLTSQRPDPKFLYLCNRP